MKSKAQHAKRLVIYLLFAFGFAWIPWILMNRFWGYEEWFCTSHYIFFANLTLYAPALANILTRLVTKEGFHDMKLRLRLKGHIPHYLTAWLLPISCALLGGLLVTAIYGRNNGNADGISGMGATAAVLQAVFYAPLRAFLTLGEEFGWRGYMNDKMKPLFGTAGTVLIGGTIWGIWHAPLTVEGHNFGRDYAGYPYTGFLMMMLYCICLGTVLMWLTDHTGSVFPAAVFHAIVNFGAPTVFRLIARGVPQTAESSVLKEFIVPELPIVLFSILFLILLLFRRKPVQKPI